MLVDHMQFVGSAQASNLFAKYNGSALEEIPASERIQLLSVLMVKIFIRQNDYYQRSLGSWTVSGTEM
jgi:hypothetical protein